MTPAERLAAIRKTLEFAIDKRIAAYPSADVEWLLELVARQQAVVEAAATWSHWGKVKVLHVLTCKECERLEGVEDRWCEEAGKIGRAQLDAAKALNAALDALDAPPAEGEGA